MAKEGLRGVFFGWVSELKNQALETHLTPEH